MQTILNEQEEQALREHLALKVRPRFQSRTIDKIIEVVNKIRVGEMQETDFVNPTTKILTWDVMLENFGLYPKFVKL